MGIEADGAIKGRPSLPTSAYTGGTIRQQSLRQILAATPELNFNAGQGSAAAARHLWGSCETCEYAELCRGGCSWTAHVFFGRRGNNPYCHHRALVNRRNGRRERLMREEAAPGVPFDHGRFALLEEPFEAAWPEPNPRRFRASEIRGKRRPRTRFPIIG